MKPPVEAPTSSADQPARVDLERVERRRQLVAAAADVRLRLGHADGVSAATRSPGLRSCRAASPSPTLTAPASTSACARLRVSTSPRSTSSWSSRTRWTLRRCRWRGLIRLSWHTRLHRQPPGTVRDLVRSRQGDPLLPTPRAQAPGRRDGALVVVEGECFAERGVRGAMTPGGEQDHAALLERVARIVTARFTSTCGTRTTSL